MDPKREAAGDVGSNDGEEIGDTSTPAGWAGPVSTARMPEKWPPPRITQ